jgi:hypothetical protein
VTEALSVASTLAPGWTRYDSVNKVLDLAFASDGTLWAATNGGLVHWVPDSESYTKYGVSPSRLALAPGGALWLVIDGQLWHFDGSVLEFQMAPRLLDGAIRSLVVGPDGTLWISTGQGISRFEGGHWQEVPSSVAADMLASGPGGEVWAATREGVGRYLSVEDEWVTYTEDDGLPSGTAQMIAVNQEGVVWAYYPWEGVFVFDSDPDNAVWTRVEDPCGTRLSDLVSAKDGTVWASSAGSGHYPGACVAYYDGEQWVEIAADSGISSTATLAPGPSGELAVSTSQGIGFYTGDEWQILRDGPTSDSITTVAVTPDGDAWFAFGDNSVSTPGGGLSRLDGQTWEYHLDDAEVTALAVAPDGTLWAGAGCAVKRYDGGDWQTLARCGEELPPGNILDIAFTADGTAWVANGFSLASYDGNRWTVLDKLAHSVVTAPQSGAGAEGLWVSGWEGTQDSMYVARFSGENWVQYPVTESVPGSFFPSAVTPDGRLCGLDAGLGLACFDGGEWSSADDWTIYEQALGLDLGQTLGPPVAAPDGTLWALTPAGLLRWDAGAEADDAWMLHGLGAGAPPLKPGPLAFGPEGEVWVGATRYQP